MPQLKLKALEQDLGTPEEVLERIGLLEADMTQALQPDIIRSQEDMLALKAQWEALSAACAEPLSHFQSFDWCMNWVKYAHNPAREELSIIPIWKGAELVALLPMMITQEKLGLRVMRFLGEPIIEYCNVLIDKNKVSTAEVIDAWQTAKTALSVDAFIFTNFPSCSCLFNIFGAHAISRSPAQASTIMDLTRINAWEEYLASQSRSARRSRTKRWRKLEELGAVSYRVFEGGTKEYKNIVAQSVRMKSKWLKETGRNAGELFSGDTIDAVKHMNGSLAHMEGAIAGALMIDDKIVATEVGFLKDHTYLSYIGAFDWDMRKHSVGKMQIEAALKWSFENGVRTYDFLGEPSVYKSEWSNDEVALYACNYGTSIKGKTYTLWTKKLRPLVKTMFHAMPLGVRKLFISLK